MIATVESAGEIRASYYRKRAAAIRERAISSESKVFRAELCGLANDYERLAELVRSFPDTTEPQDVLWRSLKARS